MDRLFFALGALSGFLAVGFGAFALNSSAFLLLIGSLGVVLASKIVLAVLLAMAPLVAGMLLFEATRGMVEGWLKQKPTPDLLNGSFKSFDMFA